jgi:hypothetical protein
MYLVVLVSHPVWRIQGVSKRDLEFGSVYKFIPITYSAFNCHVVA